MALDDLKILREKLASQIAERVKNMTTNDWEEAQIKSDIVVSQYMNQVYIDQRRAAGEERVSRIRYLG